jgi:His/Glu/Gln/Arg/opine family amino acid ABC transporter permease subunit
MGFYPKEIPGIVEGLLWGLRTTVVLTVLIMAIAMVLALPVALARISKHEYLRYPATLYVQVMRGTPLLLQLFYLYYVLPFAGIRMNPWMAGIAGMSVNGAAYLSEVYRAGIQAIDLGQTEAALSIGMSRFQVTRLIVLPQAFKITIPPISNQFIGLFKDTSLLSVLTIQELLYTGQIMAATSFRFIMIFTIIMIMYLAVCWPTALLIDELERRQKALPPANSPKRLKSRFM